MEEERRERSVKTLKWVNYVSSKCVVHGKLNFYLNNFNWYCRERVEVRQRERRAASLSWKEGR